MGESPAKTAGLGAWAEHAPAEVDLTVPEQDAWARAAADALLDQYAGNPDALTTLEAGHRDAPVLLRLAMKLAASKMRVAGWPPGARLSIVYAVYKEHNRLRSPAEHPHGENSLVRKVEQIEWLLRGSGVGWRMLIVDDGCPEHSGRVAQAIVDEQALGDRVEVRFLDEAIRDRHPAARGLTSTDESQKGGSIQYGMAVMANDDPEHVVAFTDADLSTHLGQLGLLAHPIFSSGYDAAIGSRREPLSVVIKSGARDSRGKLFIYLWKRLIPILNPIIDTQCGFKAFRADSVRALVDDMLEKRFAFDIELLVRAELERAGSIARVPIAWIDSEAASTTKELQPYLPMLQSIVRIASRYLPPRGESRGFAELIGALDQASWERLASNVPEEIVGREPAALEEYAGVNPGQLRRIAAGV